MYADRINVLEIKKKLGKAFSLIRFKCLLLYLFFKRDYCFIIYMCVFFTNDG